MEPTVGAEGCGGCTTGITGLINIGIGLSIVGFTIWTALIFLIVGAGFTTGFTTVNAVAVKAGFPCLNFISLAVFTEETDFTSIVLFISF